MTENKKRPGRQGSGRKAPCYHPNSEKLSALIAANAARAITDAPCGSSPQTRKTGSPASRQSLAPSGFSLRRYAAYCFFVMVFCSW